MSVMITLGVVCWNTRDVTVKAVQALIEESRRLTALHFRVDLVVIDNASTDDTVSALTKLAWEPHVPTCVLGREHPIGSSCLRNDIIELSAGSDYLLLTDGDIEIIPGSVVALLAHLLVNPEVSCIAMDPLGSTEVRSKASPRMELVRGTSVDSLMYVCGYGLFRRSILQDIRFNEGGPFAEVGWGSEDDDLYLQMLEQDFQCLYATGYTYLHSRPRSSWDSLRREGVDPEHSFQQRRAYLLNTWRHRPRVADRLQLLSAQHIGTEIHG